MRLGQQPTVCETSSRSSASSQVDGWSEPRYVGISQGSFGHQILSSLQSESAQGMFILERRLLLCSERLLCGNYRWWGTPFLDVLFWIHRRFLRFLANLSFIDNTVLIRPLSPLNGRRSSYPPLTFHQMDSRLASAPFKRVAKFLKRTFVSLMMRVMLVLPCLLFRCDLMTCCRWGLRWSFQESGAIHRLQRWFSQENLGCYLSRKLFPVPGQWNQIIRRCGKDWSLCREASLLSAAFWYEFTLRLFFSNQTGLHASISTHICAQMLNRTSGVWVGHLIRIKYHINTPNSTLILIVTWAASEISPIALKIYISLTWSNFKRSRRLHHTLKSIITAVSTKLKRKR